MARGGKSQITGADDTLIPPNMRRSLPIALVRAREVIAARFRVALAPYGMTEQQWRVIRVLAGESPLDATAVADRAAVLAPSLTRILRLLEKRDYVRRSKDASDQRRILLELAPAGLALMREVVPKSRVVYDEIAAGLGKEKLEKLLDLLGELSDLRL